MTAMLSTVKVSIKALSDEITHRDRVVVDICLDTRDAYCLNRATMQRRVTVKQCFRSTFRRYDDFSEDLIDDRAVHFVVIQKEVDGLLVAIPSHIQPVQDVFPKQCT